jgi:hypothetical protein
VKAARGLTIGRMVELGSVSRASFYRFGEGSRPGTDPDMDLRDAIQRTALEWPSYGRPRITAELRRRGWKVTFGCRPSSSTWPWCWTHFPAA